ncbi:MAG: pyrroloquinoline quinone-dependent dehydrogenase [Acidobacteria bacterium]|nr:pyrroloquinoline quinone-dependent dehydrogenase [Acidobacteriota bacterium]
MSLKRTVRMIVALTLGAMGAGLWLMPEGTGQQSGYATWTMFGGGPENTHYSSLAQINRSNVRSLEVAWEYETGDSSKGTEIQCNPIIVDGVMYVTSPTMRVIALDAATGSEIWKFDPFTEAGARPRVRNRGVTWWSDGKESRIFFGYRNLLHAVDAKTGRLVETFGRGGRVDLREGLDRDASGLSISLSTPGVIYRDLLIVGSLVNEGLPGAPGHIRAYDVRTGQRRWIFHTIPLPDEYGYDTWPKEAWKYSGGANNWAGMVVDQKRGLLYAPTGSASFDFYGANRHGDNLFANTLLCLDAATGERKWHFQAIRHDVWDRDFPTAPVLVSVRRDGRPVDAVAQATKSGHLYLFDRVTGRPLFPIEEHEAPPSGIEGEKLAAKQPLPVLPPPFARQVLTEDLLTRRTPEAHQFAMEQFRKLKSNGQFTPPSHEGTIIFPGFDGGAEWGGSAFDPNTGMIYVNSNEAWVLRIVPRPQQKKQLNGRELYLRECADCHRADLRGTPPEFPALTKMDQKFEAPDLYKVIRQGMGRMPAFIRLETESIDAIVQYLLTGKDNVTVETRPDDSPNYLKYTMDGYNKFLDHEGYPAIAPPWGTLNAIDLHHGKIAWQIPFGEYPELVAKGMRNTGSENYGGPLVTAGGLLFIGATNFDRKFRAFDKKTGVLLWETTLPAGGNATPATYQVRGKQYVVIAAGGGKSGSISGGKYVAFGLK